MIDNLVRDLQLLWKADTLIGKIWLDVVTRRTGLFVFAGLVAAFGLGMANIAGLYALQTVIGSIWAAAVVACIDFVLAIIVMLVARQAGPGREIELAFDVRNTAVASLQVDARDLKLALDTLGQEMRAAKDTIVGFAHNPLDVAAQKLLVPAAMSIIRGLRARKEQH